MKKLLLIGLIWLLNCTSTHVEKVVSSKGLVLKLNGAKFIFPENSITESTLVRVERKGVIRKSYEEGYKIVGEAFVIRPENIIFEQPVLIFYPTTSKTAKLGAKIGKGLVPLAESQVEGETLRAKIWHGGEYYVVDMPKKYGILNHSQAKEAMLVVSDIYVGDYLKKFRESLRNSGYNLPIWTFIYSAEKTIEENARFLTDELKKLHEEYGKFRLDIVNFGIGGLITYRYGTDTSLYQHDLSSAVVAVGTAFKGSNFANLDRAREGRSPYAFFFLDGLGEKAGDLLPQSDLVSWINSNWWPIGFYLSDVEENKNFASLSGKKLFAGQFPEESDGDGLVSLNSTLLTAIEPGPFAVDHFELYEDTTVFKEIKDFVRLYRTFNWPLVFQKIWKGEEKFSKISEIWEKEAKLNFHQPNDFEVLLEWNENLLKSAPEDAILITNGDNDTYPGWYLQEKGVRPDVLIVNRSLLNLAENARFLKKRGLPLEITDEELDKLKPYRTRTGKIVLISDYLIELLLNQKKRPVVFATTVYDPNQYNAPLKLSGLVYEIGKTNVKMKGDEGDFYVDIERTKELLHKTFSFAKFFSTSPDSLSDPIRHLSENYAATAFSLSRALIEIEKYEAALTETEFARRFKDQPMFSYNAGFLYIKLGNKDMAIKIFKELMALPSTDLKVKKNVAAQYYAVGLKEEAIKILAECLKTDPEDKELTALINRYQEK